MDQNVAFDEEQFFGGRRVKLGGRARDGVTETSSRSLKKTRSQTRSQHQEDQEKAAGKRPATGAQPANKKKAKTSGVTGTTALNEKRAGPKSKTKKPAKGQTGDKQSVTKTDSTNLTRRSSRIAQRNNPNKGDDTAKEIESLGDNPTATAATEESHKPITSTISREDLVSDKPIETEAIAIQLSDITQNSEVPSKDAEGPGAIVATSDVATLRDELKSDNTALQKQVKELQERLERQEAAIDSASEERADLQRRLTATEEIIKGLRSVPEPRSHADPVGNHSYGNGNQQSHGAANDNFDPSAAPVANPTQHEITNLNTASHEFPLNSIDSFSQAQADFDALPPDMQAQLDAYLSSIPSQGESHQAQNDVNSAYAPEQDGTNETPADTPHNLPEDNQSSDHGSEYESKFFDDAWYEDEEQPNPEVSEDTHGDGLLKRHQLASSP